MLFAGLFIHIGMLAGISGDYQTYSGLDAAMDGSVKFIYRTEAVEKAE